MQHKPELDLSSEEKTLLKQAVPLTSEENLFLDYLIDSAIESINNCVLQNNHKSSNLKATYG